MNFIKKILLYFFIFSSAYEIIYIFGVDTQLISKVYIFGIPLGDINLLVFSLYFIFNFQKIKNYTDISLLLFCLILLLYGTIIGILNYRFKNTNFLNYDIRIFLWFFSGYSIGDIILNSKKVKFNVKLIVIIYTVLMLGASITTKSLLMLTENTQSLSRIAHPSLYLSSGILMPFYIFFILFFSNNKFDKYLILIIITLFGYFTVYLSATRTYGIIGLFILFLIIIRFTLVNYENISFSINSKKISIYFFLSLILMIIIANYNTSDSRIERLISDKETSSLREEKRMTEIFDFFESTTLPELLIGKGFGAKFSSSMYNYENDAFTMHIGIFNFWFKFGFLIFFIFFIFTIIYIPLRFTLLQLTLLFRNLSYFSYVSFVFFSSLIPWTIQLILSGGYSESCSMLLSFSFYFKKYYKHNSNN
jgi:hypothetical protein